MSFLELLSHTVPGVLESLYRQSLQPFVRWRNQQAYVPCGFTPREKRPWRRILKKGDEGRGAEMRTVQIELQRWQQRFHLEADWALETAVATLDFWSSECPAAYLRDHCARLRSGIDLESPRDLDRVKTLALIERTGLFWAHPLPDTREELFDEAELRLSLELSVPSLQTVSRARATALLRMSANTEIERKLDELTWLAKERGWQKRRKPPRRHGVLTGGQLLWLVRWQVQGWTARRIATHYSVGGSAQEKRQGALRQTHSGEHLVRRELRAVARLLALPLRRGRPGRPKKNGLISSS